MDTRVSWDEYFMNIARVVATRSTCDRKHVGAVIVRDKTILSTGYNGSIRGLPHCTEAGHMMEDGHCVATVHAEANAIIQAAKNGVAIEGASIYTTASPCWPCFKLIANAGFRRIVFGEFYRDNRIFEFAQRLGIELVELKVPPKPDVSPSDTGHARADHRAAGGVTAVAARGRRRELGRREGAQEVLAEHARRSAARRATSSASRSPQRDAAVLRSGGTGSGRRASSARTAARARSIGHHADRRPAPRLARGRRSPRCRSRSRAARSPRRPPRRATTPRP